METTTTENQLPNSQEQDQSNSSHLINVSNLIKVKGFEASDYGQVIIYQDPIKSQLIAVKTISTPEVINKDDNSLFERFMKFKHKCIAPVIGYNSNPPQIATTYLSQCSLKDLMIEREIGKKNLLSNPNSVAKIIVGIVRGMNYIHYQIEHCDLKPSNILIDEDGNPIIIDYYNHNYDVSFKNLISSKTDTKFYLPIETINNDKNKKLDLKKIDSYSFAIILYELLFNKPVFQKNISSDLFIQQISNQRPNIPDTIHPVVKQIIEQCWSNKIENRLSFYEIFQKLKQIDFKITQDVEPEIIKSYIDSLSKQTEVKIKLWSGQLMPILVSNDDCLFEIREKIAEKANIDFSDVILSRNKKPLTCCCWDCNQTNVLNFEILLNGMKDRDLFLSNPVFELAVRIFAVAEDYPIFDEQFSFLSVRNREYKPGGKNETSFIMVPGTIQDLIDNVLYQRRHLWMLKNYKLKIRYNKYVRHPHESMFDDGIKNNAHVIVDVNWDTWVEINKSVVRCNLDDPVDELICRYVMMKNIEINGIPCLSNYGVNVDLNSSLTIRESGIKEMDNLEFSCIQTDHHVLIEGVHVCYDPKHSIRTLKLLWILATKKWIPICKLCSFSYFIFDNDKRDDKPIYCFIHNGCKFELSLNFLSHDNYESLQY